MVSDSVYVTSHGDYYVETDYIVEKPNSIVVPMRTVLSSDCSIFDSDYPSCADELEITTYDTTLTDCYSIIKTMTMTMLGSGVEFGERTTTTLARDLGIVDERIQIRWSVAPIENDTSTVGEIWFDYSKISLNNFRSQLTLE